jgi:hypothetical protein
VARGCWSTSRAPLALTPLLSNPAIIYIVSTSLRSVSPPVAAPHRPRLPRAYLAGLPSERRSVDAECEPGAGVAAAKQYVRLRSRRPQARPGVREHAARRARPARSCGECGIDAATVRWFSVAVETRSGRKSYLGDSKRGEGGALPAGGRARTRA